MTPASASHSATAERPSGGPAIAVDRSPRHLAISVIIPTCDRPDYLREAVASVLVQTLRPSEILVIDNGLEPVVLPSELPVALHRIASRAGPSRARNFGAALATGTHLAFLDDDDWWEPDFLREAAAVAIEGGFACVYGRKDICRSGVVQRYKLATPAELTIPVLLRRNPGTAGSNLLVERELFLRVGGFDERLRLSEDRSFPLEVLLAGQSIGVAANAVAVLRDHGSERLRQRGLKKLGFIWKYRRIYPLGGFVSALVRALAAGLLKPVAAALRSKGKGMAPCVSP